MQKRTILLALAMLVLVLPFGTGIAAADSGTFAGNSMSLPVSLQLQGGVANAGTQSYVLRGGQLLAGSVLGLPINTSTATLRYSMFSFVYGSNVWGVSHIELDAEALNGQSVNVEAWAFLNESESLSVPAGCTTSCTIVPEFFLGGSIVTATIGGVSQNLELPLAIESAYLNPFGGPIVISSMDPQTSIFLVTTYSVGTINWYGVQMAGLAAGTYGGSQVMGTFAMNVYSRENLVTGIEHDYASIALTGAGPNGGNAQGTLRGISVIPTQGESSCAAMFGLPSGTCAMTGLNSTGIVSMRGNGYQITGGYHTIWGIPALGFVSTVHATATPTHQGHNHW